MPSKDSKGQQKVHRVMKEHKQGELKSGSGKKGHEPKTGCGDRSQRSSQIWCANSEEALPLVARRLPHSQNPIGKYCGRGDHHGVYRKVAEPLGDESGIGGACCQGYA